MGCLFRLLTLNKSFALSLLQTWNWSGHMYLSYLLSFDLSQRWLWSW